MTPTPRRERWTELGMLVTGLVLVIGGVVAYFSMQDQRLHDRAEVLAEVQRHRTEVLEEQAVALEQQAVEACKVGNGAQRATRELAQTINGILVLGLQLSPHSAQFASAIETQVNQAIAKMASYDRDCDGSGELDEGDYPPS